MTTKKEDILPEEGDVSGEQKQSFVIDLDKIYSFDLKDMVPDISAIHYSNLAYIQVSHRDVCIDFLRTPGIQKDGKVLLTGARIYMSHAAAQRLAESLDGLLEHVYSKGGMEMYHSKEKHETKSD